MASGLRGVIELRGALTYVQNSFHVLPAHFLIDNVVLEFSHLEMLSGVRMSDTVFLQSN